MSIAGRSRSPSTPTPTSSARKAPAARPRGAGAGRRVAGQPGPRRHARRAGDLGHRPHPDPRLLPEGVDSTTAVAGRRGAGPAPATESLIGAWPPGIRRGSCPTPMPTSGRGGIGQGEPLMETLVAAVGTRCRGAGRPRGHRVARRRRLHHHRRGGAAQDVQGARRWPDRSPRPGCSARRQRIRPRPPSAARPGCPSCPMTRPSAPCSRAPRPPPRRAEHAAVRGRVRRPAQRAARHPGRTAFVVAPRSFNPDPAAAQRFLAAAATIPWLSPTTTDASPGHGQARGRQQRRRRSPGPSTPSAGGPPS